MFYLLLLILGYFISVLQTSFVHFNLLLLLVFVFSTRLTFPQAVFFAFMVGLFVDAAAARILGQSSLGFILILSIMPLLTYRFSFQNPVSRFIMYFISSLLFEIYLGHGLIIWQNMLISFLAVILGNNEKETIKL